MVTGRFEIQIEDFAASLASGDAGEQSKFFNIFFKALRINCENNFRYDTQLCSIDEGLSRKTKESLKILTFEEEE